MTLFSAVVLAIALVGSPQTPDQRAEAERLARSGAYAAALKQFQALAAANPDDIDARVWIGRLYAQLGEPERAIDVFRSVVAAQPQNVEALIGLGDAATTIAAFHDAADALNRAEALAADRPAVMVAQGRLHRKAGHSTLALAYYGKALAIEPGNAAAREALDELNAERAHRVSATYGFERFSSADPDTHVGTIEVNARVGDTVRVFGAGQHARKFARDEDRGGGGVEWMARRNLQVRAGGLFGSNTAVLPDADALFELTYLRRRDSWIGGVRYLHFAGSSSLLWTAGVSCALGDRLSASFHYYHSSTDSDLLLNSLTNDGFSIGATGRVAKRLWVNAGYELGFEGLPFITTERVSQFDSDNLTAGALFEITPRTAIGATYLHQWRDADVHVRSAFVKLVQRF